MLSNTCDKISNIIYGLIDPLTEELRYIGKSVSGLDRPREHFKPCNLIAETHKTHWIRSILQKKIKPLIIILEILRSAEELDDAEIFWIEYYKSIGCKLTNATNGGVGSLGRVVSDETKEKQSEAAKNRDWSDYVPHNKKYQIIDGEEYKFCGGCEQYKNTIVNFNKRSRTSKKFQSKCKNCMMLYQREWKKKHPHICLSKEEFRKTRRGGHAGGMAISNSPELRANLSKKLSKAIIATHIETNETIHFSSALEAKKQGFQNTNIGQAIKYNKPYRGYTWKFNN